MTNDRFFLVVDSHGQYKSNLFHTTYDIGKAQRFSNIDVAMNEAAKLNETWRITSNRYRVVRVTIEEIG